MPQMTPHSGIWLKKIEGETTEKRIRREYMMYKLLIDQIEASGACLYQQCFFHRSRKLAAVLLDGIQTENAVYVLYQLPA